MRQSLHAIIAVASVAFLLMFSVTASAATIAAILSSDQPRYREAHRAFVKSIAAHGYKTPTTEITLQTPHSDPISLAAEIRKVNNSHPDLIVTYGAPAALVAGHEAPGTPVISVDVFASEQAVKGLCGVSSRVSLANLLSTQQKIRPFQRLGILYTPRDSGSQQQFDDVKKVASRLGIAVLEASVTSSANLDGELNRLFEKSEAVLITEGGLLSQQFDRIIAKSRSRKIPVLSTMPDGAEKGALVSLEINPQEQGYLAAEMAVRVLEGARTEYLPLIRPQRIDLVINMRQAREIGIQVPAPVLRSASRLIK
jgi:putative ABC transport system substrate-binding protein